MATTLSLPVLKSLSDCADFGKTVAPYIPQLTALPQSLVSAASSDSKLQDVVALYLNTNPFITAIAIALFLSPIVLVVSEINKNYSQVDRLWSILPAFYVGHYTLWAHANGLPTQRLDNAAVVAASWSVRLTFNYWRRGGYNKGSEDYRWPIIKQYIGNTNMFILNCTFVSFIQNILLCLSASPAYVLLLASRVGPEKMQFYDIVFSRFLMALILVESFADQQQWNYQEAKRKYRETAKLPAGSPYSQEDLDRGFVVSGLWAWSRHPNVCSEQLIWVTFYQWSCFATDTIFNWTGTGAALYVMVVQLSTWLTELISSRKYPEYKEYRRLVGRFLPRILAPAAQASEIWAPPGFKHVAYEVAIESKKQ